MLLERHNIPGGAATSFTRGRFEFEVSLHELAAYGSSQKPQPIRQILNWLGVKSKMNEIPGAYRYIITGQKGFDVALPNGREACIDKIDEVVPGSRSSVSKLFDMGEECIKGFCLLQGGTSMIDIQQQCPDFVKYLTIPYKQVLEEIGIPDKAREILEAYWCYIGIPSDEFNFPYFAQMLVTYVEDGAYAPLDRSHGLSSALVKNIEEHGGTVWFNTEVKKILTDHGVATGVQIGDRSIYAREIISNIIPDVVYAKMIDPAVVPKRATKLSNARQLGTSGFLVYLGLNKSPEELGIKDYSVFISSTGDARQQFERMGTIDQNDFMIMNCLNKAVPDCSPAGTTILYATQLYRNCTWDRVSPAKYQALKEQVDQRIIDQYEQATGIQIHDTIEEIEIAAPETFARYMRTPNGEIYGYYGQSWDQTFGRTSDLAQGMQPIPHLFFCGGFSYMMDGYSSAYFAGYTAAKMSCAAIDQEGDNND